MGGMVDSHGRRRRRAVDGEQLLALGATAVAKAGGEACAEAGRAKEDGVGRAAVVIVDSVASPPAVADFPALQFDKGLADVVEALARAVIQRRRRRAARGAHEEAKEQQSRDDVVEHDHAERFLPVFGDATTSRATALSSRMRRLILIYLTRYLYPAERRRADQRAELAKACASSDAPTRGFSSVRFLFPIACYCLYRLAQARNERVARTGRF